MTSKRSTEIITFEDRRILRLFKITKSVLPRALYLIFKYGCKKEEDESIEHYLTKTKTPPMGMGSYKKKFNKDMQKAVTDEDPSGETYDVKLLCVCIQWGCDGLDKNGWKEGEDKLESLCATVRNYRNKLCHEDVRMPDETAMKNWCTKIIKVLEKLLKSAARKYTRLDYEKEMKDIKNQIDMIMEAPLGDCLELRREIQAIRERAKKAVTEEGKNELAEQYKDISKIDPASFITGKERLNVENVFTKLEVICDSKSESLFKTNDIEYNKILKVKTEEGKEPVIIIVEGDAGAGKTTLSKLILSNWAEGSSNFEGLQDYDLVLYGEGKNKHISSYLELIQALLPLASYELADDDLLHAVLQLKVLLVMDSFDELNTESEKLIREILQRQIPRSNGKLQLLITTRPSKLSDLLNIANRHSVMQAKLIGISVNNRIEFVSKLHDEMVSEGQSNQVTRNLVAFMEQSQSCLGEHYRLPLNLTLLTYLWASDPDKVNPETTATGLYIASVELLQSRLLKKLQNLMGDKELSQDKFDEIMRKFLPKLYSVCLDTLSSGSLQLSCLSRKALKETCEKFETLKLPFSKMSEAFLTVEKEWTTTGYKTDLTVPHKSIMEFYAANEFMNYITNKNDSSSQEADIMLLLERMEVPEEGREEIQRMINKYSNPEDVTSLKTICHKLLKTDKHLTMDERTLLHLAGLDVPEEGRKEIQIIINKYSNNEDFKSSPEISHKRLKTDKNLTAYENMFLHLTCLDVPEEGKEEIQRIIRKYSNPKVAKFLKKICHKCFKTDLAMYENMFLHLTGLLAHHCPSKLQEYAQELVEILRNAGIQGTKWLDVLVEAKCDEKLAELLAPIYSGKLIVRDGHMRAALVLLKHLGTNTPIKIILENEVPYIPHLEDMLCQLSKRNCNVEISFAYQWKNQECDSSYDPLNYVLHEEDGDHKCKVTSFTGHLKSLSSLPKSLKKLCITFATTDHAQQLLKELPDLMKTNHIRYLGIHVMPAVEAVGLSPLPDSECTILWLSKVAGDLKAKCQVIQALLPFNGMFDFLMFPQSNFSVDQCGEVISELCRLKVKVSKRGGLCFSSSIIKDEELSQLQCMARDELGCELCCMDESAIW